MKCPNLLRSIALVALLWLVACSAPVATPSPEPQRAAVAPTAIPLPPSATPAPPSATPAPPSSTPAPPTATPILPTPTPAPLRVGLQVGHWRLEELPAELQALRRASGAYYRGYDEWEVNIILAELTAERLRQAGIVVDLLPATVPPGYRADAFISIHCDGVVGDAAAVRRGWKVAVPWRASPASQALAEAIATTYGEITGLPPDPQGPSYDMRTYYAFSHYRFEHAIAPDTPSVIMETAFMTHPADRELLFNQPDLIAEALATGIFAYLAGYDRADQAARSEAAFPLVRPAGSAVPLLTRASSTAAVELVLEPTTRLYPLSETDAYYLVISLDTWDLGWVAKEMVIAEE